MKTIGSILVLTVGAPAIAAAQGAVGVAAHVGTLGLGADAAVSLAPRVNVRAGVNVFPADYDGSASDVDFSFSLPSPQFTAVADLMLGGAFRLSGGLLISPEDFTLTGNYVGSVTIGANTYTDSEVGSLTGAIVHRDVAPYVGIGVGNVVGSRVGFFLDVGAAFHGEPAVALDADGLVASDPAFQADLESERRAIEDDLSAFSVYPVISLGISFRLTP